jgi:hypothetical protein
MINPAIDGEEQDLVHTHEAEDGISIDPLTHGRPP